MASDSATALVTQQSVKAYVDAQTPGAGVFLPLAGGTIDGTLIIDTDTGAQPFYITRSGVANQALSIYTDDVASYFTTIQDETTGTYGSMVFKLDTGAPSPIFNFQYGSSTLMKIQANGNVGIRTTSPGENLSIVGESTHAALSLQAGPTTYAGYKFNMRSQAAENGFFMEMGGTKLLKSYGYNNADSVG
jgi:uncharacterized membrane protein